MNIFSQEYRDSLIAEHKLVSAAMLEMQQLHPSRYTSKHGPKVVGDALILLQTQRVALEAKIDVLNEHLS